MSYASRDLIVGRTTELERASAAIDRAFSGNGQTLSIIGEPGIGKTALLDWIADAVGERNGLVLSGRCYDDPGSPAYWAWNEIIRSHLRNIDTDVAADLYGDPSGRLVSAFPALGGVATSDLRPVEFEDPAEARFLLHDELAGAVHRASESRPVALLLDDFQWADESSLLLLEHLSKALANSAVLVVFAHWDLHQAASAPLTRLLGGLSRERSFHRLQLRRLSREDSRRLVSSLGLAEVLEPVERAIYELTEGNPFFIGEIARLLLSDETSHRDLGKPEAVPDSIRSMMTRRLASVSPEVVGVLETAAIIGHEFETAVLRASLPGESRPDLAEHLAQAEALRFIDRVDDRGARWQFVHGLLQRSLLAELSPRSKESLHASVLVGFETVLGDAADERASELAEHALQSESIVGSDRVVRYCTVAGERAIEAHLPAEANRLFELAIDRTDLDVCSEQTALLLGRNADALFASGASENMVAAAFHSRLAVECYIRLERPYDAALHLARPVRADYGLTGVAELYRKVLGLIDPESREAGLLHAGLILWSYLDEFDFEASMASFDRAMQIADALDDDYLRLLCLANSGTVNRHYGNRGKDVEHASQAAALAMRLDRRYLECQARFVTATHYMFEGRLTEAQSDVERGLQLARQLGDIPRLVSAISARMELALVLCDFDVTRTLAQEALELDPSDARILRDLACAGYLTGDHGQGARAVTALMNNHESGPEPGKGFRRTPRSSIPMLAATLGFAVTRDSASMTRIRPWLNELVERVRAGADVGEGQPVVGLLCTRLEPDSDLAAQLLKTIETPIEWKWMRATVGSVALAAGDEARAREELQSCYEIFRDEYSPLPLAWTCLEYSDALIKMADPADHELIGELHESGIKLAIDHRMSPLQRMLESSRDAYALCSPRAVDHTAGLSDREIEVIRLVAGGLSNAEIAEQLIISPHTVNRHVTNLFSKLDVSSRAAATDKAHRLGII